MPLLPVPTLNVNNFRRYKGDSSALPIELQDPNTGDPFNPTDWVLVFTVKRRANVPDQEALIQKISTVEGITVTNAAQGKITVQLLVPDFEHIYPERMYVFDVRAQNIADPELVYTVAIGTIWFAATPTHEATLSVPTYTVSPAALINALNELLDNALEDLEPLIEELIEDKADVDQSNVNRFLRRRTVPTVAAFKALAPSSVADGERIDLLGYFSPGDGGGGPLLISTTLSTEDNFSVFALTGGGAEGRRVFESNRIDIRMAGFRISSDTDDQYAAANSLAARAITDYLSTRPGWKIIVPETGAAQCYWAGRAQGNAVFNIPKGTTLEVNGYVKRAQYTSGSVGSIVGIGGDDCVVTGWGTLDNNAFITGPRVEGVSHITRSNAYISSTARITNTTIENVQTVKGQQMSINLLNFDWVRVRNCRVLNAYGSARVSPSDSVVSGINHDGIHFFNCTKITCTNNYVEAIDDCIALTWYQYPGFIAHLATALIQGNVGVNRKAANVAAPGIGVSGTAGTLSRYSGCGFRASIEGGTTGITASDISVLDNEFSNGVSGCIIGDSGGTAAVDYVVSKVKIARNRFNNIAAAAGSSPTDYLFVGADRAGLGGIFVSNVNQLIAEDNEFDYLGITALYVRQSANIELRKNKVRDLDTSRCGITVSNVGQRAAVNVQNNPATKSIINLLIDENDFDTIDGAAIQLAKDTGAGVISGVRVRNNRATNINTSGQTTGRGAVYSLRNGSDAAGIGITEFTNNRVDGYVLTGKSLATEQSGYTITKKSVLLAINQWSANVFGSGKMFAAANSGGTMTGTVVAEFNGIDNVLRCVGTGAGDEVRTAPYSAAPWIGRAMQIKAKIWVVSGNITINNTQVSAPLSPESTPCWQDVDVTLSANEASAVRVRFTCLGGAAEFYLGPVEARLINL